MLLSGPRACKKAAVEEVGDMTLNFFSSLRIHGSRYTVHTFDFRKDFL